MSNQFINGINIYQAFSYMLIAIVFSAVIAFPIINFLYRFRILRHLDVDSTAVIENRRLKIGTPIMGGLIFIIPVFLINAMLNFGPYTDVPLLIFVAAALLGGLDDILNIFGRARRIRPVGRILTLIRVHKSKLIRIKLILTLPLRVYARIVHIFESNPGKGLFAHEKLFVQLLLALLLGFWVYSAGVVAVPGFLWIPVLGGINLGILIIPFTVIALLGMTNAVNFADGLDGLSAGMLFFSFLGFFFVAMLEGNVEITLLIATVLGALLTYLYFNVSPARVQMGDIGSFSMGTLLTLVAFALDRPLLLPIIGFPFFIELLSTVVQSLFRRLFGRRLLLMAPLHHHLELLGWSEEKVVSRFWLFAIVCSLIGVWIYFL
jgi:phospho-N-acetylmuramoyl-pentapeptide-transferase